MRLFQHVGAHQGVVGGGQGIQGGLVHKADAGPTGQGAKGQVHLRVMAKGLVMAPADHGFKQRLPIEDLGRPKGDGKAEALLEQALKHL